MTRRLRPLAQHDLLELPCVCEACSFWETAKPLQPKCGVACDGEVVRSWFEAVSSEWGECGRVASQDDQLLGFIKYAPARYFPQAAHFPTGAPDEGSVLLACIHIRDDARQLGLGSVLLRAALRDLLMRGERHVSAFGFAGQSDMRYQPVMGVEFLLRNGFNVGAPHPVYPLLTLDLRSLATWTDNLEAVLESLRLPGRFARRVPSPSAK